VGLLNRLYGYEMILNNSFDFRVIFVLLLLYEIVHEVRKKKEGRKKLNYDVQTYSISATISNGQKSSMVPYWIPKARLSEKNE